MSEASQKSDLLIGAFSLNITYVSVWISSLFKVTLHLLFIPVFTQMLFTLERAKVCKASCLLKGCGKMVGTQG